MDIKMYIIAGLGNPTSKYHGTRHNVGFDAIDKIAEENGISVDVLKHRALCGKGIIAGEKVLLMKPQTFMNNSGEALRAAVDFYKADVENEVIIIYDDISLSEGRLRIRAKGSAGGHNGIKSIIAHLGTEKFKRIRIGIGGKPEHMDLADYVLGRFPAEKRVDVESSLKNASSALNLMLGQDIAAAMNRYNS
jgi:PTH1 family peptidyl-tRNA hydrolase